jgi:hypothetical protein
MQAKEIDRPAMHRRGLPQRRALQRPVVLQGFQVEGALPVAALPRPRRQVNPAEASRITKRAHAEDPNLQLAQDLDTGSKSKARLLQGEVHVPTLDPMPSQ